MTNNRVDYIKQAEDTDNRPSPGVWANCPFAEIEQGHHAGTTWFDHFLRLPVTANEYTLVEADAASDITMLATEDTGVLNMQVDTTDNHEAYIGGTANWGKITQGNKLWWEVRARLSAVADGGVALGLGEEGMAAANALVDDTGALVDKDFVGFHVLAADSDGLDAVYQTAGGAGRTVHKESAAGISGQTLTATTWFKAGLYFDGEYIHWHVNGRDVDSTGTGVLYSAAQVPDGEELNFFGGVKVGAAAAINLDLDWVRFAYLIA